MGGRLGDGVVAVVVGIGDGADAEKGVGGDPERQVVAAGEDEAVGGVRGDGEGTLRAAPLQVGLEDTARADGELDAEESAPGAQQGVGEGVAEARPARAVLFRMGREDLRILDREGDGDLARATDLLQDQHRVTLLAPGNFLNRQLV
jgi:hypothetical protein